MLCERAGGSGTWSQHGVILWSYPYTDPIFKVNADGGTCAPITTLDDENGERTHRWPAFLPDGRLQGRRQR